MQVFVDELLNLHKGQVGGVFLQCFLTEQGMDIYWRDNLQCPSEEEYKQMISDSISFTSYIHSIMFYV